MKKEIWFDMDGTIADLYSIDDWLTSLREGDNSPYINARPLVNMQVLARILNKLNKYGFSINIISWTSKDSSKDYERAVAYAKRKWIKKHLKSVKFDKINIVPYGTPKGIDRAGILFDDEINNRLEWCSHKSNMAFDEHNIIEVLRALQSA